MKNRLGEIQIDLKYKKNKDFAEFLGITPSQLTLYEKHNIEPSIDGYYKFFKKLEPYGYHMEDLMDEKEL